MGLRFSKSIKICKGLRINLSKSGASLSMGVRGARYTIGPRGRRTTVGIPGTGIYYSVNSKYRSSSAKKRESYKGVVSNANVQNRSIVSDKNGNKYSVTLDDVKKLNEHLNRVTSFHNTCSDPVDWEYIENLEPPFTEGEIGPKESDARKAYDTCKPNVLEKFNKSAFEKRKQNLYEAISVAHQEDEDAYNVWLDNVKSAKGVMDGDIDAYYVAIEAADPFADLSEYGMDVEFGTDNPDYMEIEFCSKMEDLVPIDTLKVTPTGKISHSYYTKTEFYALCQDYVCSYAIRLARELFALLPVKNVIVHALEKNDEFSDSQRTILSVCFERNVFDETNFSKGIDASDFVQCCIHNMDYKKTSGFKEIEKLSRDSVNYRIKPDENHNVRAKKLSETNAKIELPFGWHSENAEYIKSWEDPYYEVRIKYYHSKTIDEKIRNLRELISIFSRFKNEFENKGVYFEKYFDEMHLHNAGKKVNPLKEWKQELEELEDGYLNAKENEEIIAKALPTLRQDIINIIKNEPDILQKDLVKKFDPVLKQSVLDELWELAKAGIITKEKSGNSNILRIND